MIGSLSSAEYLNGEIVCSLSDSLYLGYLNTVGQYGMPNCISFPNDNAIVLLSSQNDAQVDIIGYRNNILDPTFNINKGEFCSYSNDWYMITGNNNGNGGVVLQQNPAVGQTAPVPKSEHLMMGESTNKVLENIMDSLDNIFKYLQAIQENYTLHVHLAAGANTGLPIITTVNPPVPPPTFPLPPPDPAITAKIVVNLPQITNGYNLAASSYSPITSED